MQKYVTLIMIAFILSSFSLVGQQKITKTKIVGTWILQRNNIQKDTIVFNRTSSKIESWGMYYTFGKHGEQSIDYYDKCGNGPGNSHSKGKWRFTKKGTLLTLTLPIYKQQTIYKLIEATDTKLILIAKNKV